MDLFFDPDKGMPSFTIEVGYFDTIKEIKEKVSKCQGIPVVEQTLKFDGKILADDLNIHTSDIIDGSRLKLITTTNDPQQAPHATTTKVKIEEPPSPSSCSSSHNLKMIVDMNNDSVMTLKGKMNEMKRIPLSGTKVYANGIELQDHKSMHECQIVDGSEGEVPTLQKTPATSVCSLSMGLLGKKMKVNVMSKKGEKVSVEVNPQSNVGELRKELQRVRNEGVRFGLPEEGYFFIYKQNVMEEDQSFRWHRVQQGDTLEIFNGCVTGGA
uniref:ubiquitin domain-containing protein 7SL RNA1-like n=1 Tax=Erigeron canadensis TaxID=72917 RepID=UPI001CB9C741|nr:ubiquitin domain-containing protein 7SL RNA1-like [Erigeron canadensis]